MDLLETFATFLISVLLCVQPAGSQEEDEDSWSKDKFKEETGQTFNLVFHKYNERMRPPQPFIEVNLDVTLNHIRQFDLRKQELETVLGIEMEWYDSRLEWYPERVFQIMVEAGRVWSPDIVYTNGILPSQSLYPSDVRISYKGVVLWSKKEVVRTFCRTEVDSHVHVCPISFGFMSNSRGDQTDRFFANTSTFILPADFVNNEWLLQDAVMLLGGDNQTKASALDVELTLERRTKPAGSSKNNMEELTTDYMAYESTVDNCSQMKMVDNRGENAAPQGVALSLPLTILSSLGYLAIRTLGNGALIR